MTAHRRYSRAPIQEAVLEIRVAYEGQRAIDVLRPLADALPGYAMHSAMQRSFGEIAIGAQTAASVRSEPYGFILSGDGGKYLLQVRLDGFALSRLAPYETWEIFRGEAKRLYDAYVATFSFESVIRAAVRYVNRFDFEGTNVELKDYLKAYPELPAAVDSMSGFYMQASLDQPDIAAIATLNEAGVDPKTPNSVSVILDLDVFRTMNLPNDDSIWTIIDELREREYLLFESILTDKSRELIS